MKANPENVPKATTGTLQNEDNGRVFQQFDFVTPQQLQVAPILAECTTCKKHCLHDE